MSSKKALAMPERVTITRKTVFITQLRPHPRNYRIHPPEQIAKLRASYRRLGQFRSLVAIADAEHPGDYTVVAGHGCTEAWGQEGAITVEIDELPPDTPAETVEAIMLADNLHSQGASDDDDLLYALLKSQQDAGFDLNALGSDDETLRDMLAKMTPPTLDELTEQYGDEPEDDAFWPVIRVKVSPETKELYDSLMSEAQGTDEAVKFAWVLERCNVAVEVEA